MAHLDLKRAALSVESAKQLTETRKAKSNNQGDIRFIPFLPRYSDLWLIEMLISLACAGRRGANQLCSQYLPPRNEDARDSASCCRIQENDDISLRTNVLLNVAGRYIHDLRSTVTPITSSCDLWFAKNSSHRYRPR